MPEKIIIEGGPILLVNTIPSSESVSIGVWVNIGSRDEGKREHGFSHFIEHMLFKGTRKRSAYEIALRIDQLGGEINGVTGKENTDYYINVAAQHYAVALDILTDMFFNAAFRREDFSNEKFVILNEIDLSTDDPEEYAGDLFSKALWGNSSFGMPVLGERKDIADTSLENLFDYYRRRYRLQDMVVSVAGHVGVDDCQSELERIIDSVDCPLSAETRSPERVAPKPVKKKIISERDIEQVYFVCGTDAYGYRDERRYPLMLLNTIAGGSFSSRLFQNIRENKGLCYSIASGFTGFSDCGEFTIYFSTTVDNVSPVLDMLDREMARIKARDIGAEELSMAKERFKGSYILASENVEWKMVRMALQEMMYGRLISYNETVRKIENVSLDDLYETADSVLNSDEFTFASVGPRGHGDMLDGFSFSF